MNIGKLYGSDGPGQPVRLQRQIDLGWTSPVWAAYFGDLLKARVSVLADFKIGEATYKVELTVDDPVPVGDECVIAFKTNRPGAVGLEIDRLLIEWRGRGWLGSRRLEIPQDTVRLVDG